MKFLEGLLPRRQDQAQLLQFEGNRFIEVHGEHFLGIPTSHDANIEMARKLGIEPLSFMDIVGALEETWENWVFFDTAPDYPFPGSHWRVVHVDRKDEKVELQFCGRYGEYDYQYISPLTISVHEPYFTGVSYQRFTDTEGNLVSIAEAQKKFTRTYSVVEFRNGRRVNSEVDPTRKEAGVEGLEWSEEIYWSEGAGPHLGLVDFRYITPRRTRLPSSDSTS